ncbi:uncharacterized protein PITG_20913 [Phytophthora infestans T30-4]|uniref:Uncharacterized protein n=1 Tax=Phytophthora infestans (strain T30-4) TaxID=403677 RepID=D0P2L3_PHYIT|nr:uncharacterized protein PITG_20913 [Phytophthora infestans T30-4]EEY56672.1 hypothetical protein PITG_20913 [Phytophthora infestans T30-4]|eukprot:XP_002895465.1 hypothetical protein PITG_20913 [Phytophthora infestans T30-4]
MVTGCKLRLALKNLQSSLEHPIVALSLQLARASRFRHRRRFAARATMRLKLYIDRSARLITSATATKAASCESRHKLASCPQTVATLNRQKVGPVLARRCPRARKSGRRIELRRSQLDTRTCSASSMYSRWHGQRSI